MPKSGYLMSFLGANASMVETDYCLSDHESVKASFPVVAMARFFDVERIVLLVTPTAKMVNLEKVRAELAQHELPAPKVRDIPEGGQMWGQFDTLKEALREGRDDRIVFDITNGFRALPFFAAGVISFVEAVDAHPYNLRVVYAPFAPGTTETPVWDLTPFVELTRWTHILSLFLKTGFAPPLKPAMEESRKRIHRDAHPSNEGRVEMDAVTKALRQFSDAVATVRTGDLLLGNERHGSAAHTLSEALAAARDVVRQQLPRWRTCWQR